MDYVGHYYQYPSPWVMDWKNYLLRNLFYWISRMERIFRLGNIGYFAPNIIEKLEDPGTRKLGITADIIKAVLGKPDLIDNSEYPILMAVGWFKREISLCIIYKFIENGIKVITFFPAKRGRYESKILSGR